jgi:ArsR family transcriptional regulator
MSKTNALIDPEIKKACMTIRAMSNKIRQLIILEISSSGNRHTVSEILKRLNLTQSITSQHLAILRQAKVVTNQKEGKNVYYSVDHEVIEKIKLACRQMP